MTERNFQQVLFNELRDFLNPLIETEGDPDRIFAFLESAGWDFRSDLGSSEGNLVNTVTNLITSADSLLELIDNPPRDFVELVNALKVAAEIISVIQQMPSSVSGDSLIDVTELTTDVLNALALLYILRKSPFAFRLLELLTIIRQLHEEPVVEDRRVLRVRNRLPRLDLKRLGVLLSDPAGVFRDEYWPNGFADQPTVNEIAHRLFLRIERVLSAVGESDMRYGAGRAIALVGRGAGPDELSPQEETALDGMMTIEWHAYLAEEDEEVEVGASIGLIPENDGGPGVFIVPYGRFAIGESIGGWYLGLEAQLGLEGFEITSSRFASYTAGNNVAHVTAYIQPISNSGPAILIGSTEGTRFEIGDIYLRGEFIFSEDLSEIKTMLGLRRAALVINAGDGDGFLQRLVPGDGARADFDILIGWSNIDGFHIEGSGALEIRLPIHINLGLIEVNAVTVKTLFYGEELPLELGGTIKGNLGPLTVIVEDIGVRFNLTFPDDGGNLGPIDVVPGFRPPTGAGLSLDAGGIVGGGYLEFDDPNKRYTGILALNFSEIGLTAIGLITTKLPGGKTGFSLLVNIGVIFNPPIQLPYGFTLSGVGGLVGLNRTMDVDILRRGIKARTLDSVLFPDPSTLIANANKIISDMRSVFPSVDGQYIVGPMVKFGWGYPKLITAEVGIFIELPDPIRIVLMGQVEATLPEENAALVVIHLDVLGVLDFEKEELTFQASLYDSRVLSFAIYGDSAFLLSWGNDPRFALSLGGFHPKFTPPPPPVLFAGLKRLTISISSGSSLQLACRAFQALTPQSLQFGARVDLYAKGGGAVVTGYMGFDTLIYYSPFSFEAWIGAGVKIRYQGVTLAEVELSLTLIGPTPWTARGKAKIQVLFFTVTVRFQITWGRREPSVIAPQDPWGPLQDALAASRNWSGVLPRGRKMVEALRGAETSGPETILVHPTGQLEVRQNVVPLSVTVAKFGNAPVTGHDRFEIRELWANDIEFDAEPVQDFFSRGQFEDLNDQQRLSLPEFEKMVGGVASRGGNVRTAGSAQHKDLGFESIIIKPDRTSATQPNDGQFEWEVAKVMAKVGDRQRAMKRAGPRGRFTSLRPSPKVTANEERYCVAKADDLTRATTLTGTEDNTSMTRMAADQALQTHLAQAPEDADQYIVIPEYEVAA